MRFESTGEFGFPRDGLFSPKSTWDYPAFRWTLLQVATDPANSPAESAYPDKIMLSAAWHEVLDKIRDHTQDGRERYALIGYRANRSALVLQTKQAVGTEREVSPDVIHKQIEIAKREASLEGFLGDLHSHPFTWQVEGHDPGEIEIAFSPTDLYSAVRKVDHDFTIGLVNGNFNLFAMRTRETKDLPEFMSRESFERIWEERTFIGIEMNLEIARRHHLVLYKGRTGGALYRTTGLFDVAKYFDL